MPRRASIALAGAAAAFGLLLLTWIAAFHVHLLVSADQATFIGFLGLSRPRVDGIANFVAHICNPQPYEYLAVVPPLIALLRRRFNVAVAASALLIGANVTTQLLKPLLAQPRADWLLGGWTKVAAASWPSGHATAAMALALAFVLVVPARWRPAAAAVGAVFAAAVSYSFLTLGWHYPSDVFGGYLVAGTWTLLAVAALYATDKAGTPVTRRLSLHHALAPPAVALLGATGLVLLVALGRPHAVIAYAGSHHAFLLGAAAIAALAVTLPTGLMLLSATGSGPAPTAAQLPGSHPG
jgi:membrane-associated phospholipid phosphatase